MNEMQTIATEAQKGAAAGESNVIDLLLVVARHKKLFICLPLAAAIIAGAISFTLPDVYGANTKVLPPQQAQSSAAALLSQLGGAVGMAAGVAGMKNPKDLYIGMLKSRTVADRLIKQFELMKVYGTNSLESARKTLENNTIITARKDGLIIIDVEDEDRKRVVQLANSYVNELLNLTKVLAVTEASQRRIFFERQLDLSKNNLAAAEMALRETLDTHGVISVDSDSRAIVETVARLRAQISAKEIQLSSMQAFVTAHNQDYKRAQEELNSLRSELSKLENGRPASTVPSEQRRDLQAGLENIKILRDVKYHQMLYELLSKQYEVARLDEAKEGSIIQVLDQAVEPEHKIKPRRSVIVLMAAILGVFVALALTFIFEAKEKAQLTPERAAKWRKLKTAFWLR